MKVFGKENLYLISYSPKNICKERVEEKVN